jgi:Bacterial membrane protein YfhO
MRYLRLTVALSLGFGASAVVCAAILDPRVAHFLWARHGLEACVISAAAIALLLRGTEGQAVRHTKSVEGVYLAIVGVGAVLPLIPFLHDGILGGSDARWYASVVADFITQWRAGWGPVFVGQSRFAAIGTVMPVRVAPYLQHLTLLIDLLTLRTLSPYLLLNLAVVATGTAGAISAYACLRRLATPPMLAALLSLLYAWSPATLGLAYTGQLFMSYMTLPFLPIAFCGAAVAVESRGRSGFVLMAAGCAGCWLAHPPIGLWVSAVSVIAVAAGIGPGWSLRKTSSAMVGSAILFTALCGYVFLSVALLQAPPTAPLSIETVLAVLKASAPATLLPVSEAAGSYTDLQPGWGILGVAIIACIVGVTRWRRAAVSLAFVAVLVAVMSFPIPWATEHFWRHVPNTVITVTNTVVFQRLFPLLTAITVILTGSVWAGRSPSRLFAACVGMAVAWTGLEAAHFSFRGALITTSREGSDGALSEANFTPAVFSTGMLTFTNAYFSHGYMLPELEQRILTEDRSRYLVTNLGLAAPGFDGADSYSVGSLSVFRGTPAPNGRRWIEISPPLRLEPRSHNLLGFVFGDHPYTGVLIISGTTFHHEYLLPVSGLPRSFGSAKDAQHALPLDNPTDAPVDLTLGFEVQDPTIELGAFSTFARYRLVRYEPEDLPCHLVSLMPYISRIRSPSPGWYESFRYYIPGWRATVDGKPAPVIKTSNGLIGVHIPEGQSVVSLTYVAPWRLRLAYWVTAASWLCLALACVRSYFNGGKREAL